MLNSFPFALGVGTILGFLAGLGVGGGSLLIIWLTLVLGMEQSVARSINLMFFLPAAAISSLFRWRQGALKFRKIIPGMISGCLSAALFSIISKDISPGILDKAFGILLLMTGVRELLYRPRG